MTQGISFENNQVSGGFSEKTALGIVGFTLFTASSLTSIYSPVFFTATSDSSTVVGGLRSIMFISMALVFFAMYRLVKKRDSFVRSTPVRTGFFAMQLLLPTTILIERLSGIEMPLALIAVAWACWGVSNGFFACAWVDGQGSIDESYITKISFWSFALGSCLVIGMSAMSSPTNIIAISVSVIASFAFLMRAFSHGWVQTDIHDDEWLIEKSKFNRNGSYIMLVDGILIGVVACLIFYSIKRTGLTPAILGIALLSTALLFFILRARSPELLSLEHSQLVFLPIIVCGLLFMEFTEAPWQLIFSLVLFVVLYLFDFTNSTVLSLRGNLLSVSACYCFSRGRLFIVAGQGIGWACGAFLTTELGMMTMPAFIIVLVASVCLYITVAAINPNKYPLIVNNDEERFSNAETNQEPASPTVIERPYKRKCSFAAQKYDLTPREGEILFYLAKGRNAKYIADQLFVAERTIKTHTYHIYQKMGVHSQQDLINIVEDETSPES